MKKIIATLALGLLTGLAHASPTPAPIRAEVDALMARLQSSGCQFDRNGSWYSASDAKDHILRKLEYIESKNGIQSTEQFIELAASKSSSCLFELRMQQANHESHARFTSARLFIQETGP